jgi:hypothetical protein
MKDKDKQIVQPYVYVNARTWTGIDIDGLLAIPVEEFRKKVREQEEQ